MRHKKKINHLGRNSAHRNAMLSNMASSLIIHKKIETTLAKAKALRVYVEPLITKSKDDSTHSRRLVFSELQDKAVVAELFREVAVKVANRPGGYTRILKTGTRLGDNADMCIIELVDYNENLLTAKEDAQSAAKKKKRSRKKKSDEPVAEVKAEKTAAPKKVAKEEVKAPTAEMIVAEAAPIESEAKQEDVVMEDTAPVSDESGEGEVKAEGEEEKKE